jgi:hypothetical protein
MKARCKAGDKGGFLRLWLVLRKIAKEGVYAPGIVQRLPAVLGGDLFDDG